MKYQPTREQQDAVNKLVEARRMAEQKRIYAKEAAIEKLKEEYTNDYRARREKEDFDKHYSTLGMKGKLQANASKVKQGLHTIAVDGVVKALMACKEVQNFVIKPTKRYYGKSEDDQLSTRQLVLGAVVILGGLSLVVMGSLFAAAKLAGSAVSAVISEMVKIAEEISQAFAKYFASVTKAVGKVNPARQFICASVLMILLANLGRERLIKILPRSLYVKLPILLSVPMPMTLREKMHSKKYAELFADPLLGKRPQQRPIRSSAAGLTAAAMGNDY